MALPWLAVPSFALDPVSCRVKWQHTYRRAANPGLSVNRGVAYLSGRVFRVNAGSLLPALSRMERAGNVKSEWRATENNRRAKYYGLTAKGRKALEAETEQWERRSAAIARILEA